MPYRKCYQCNPFRVDYAVELFGSVALCYITHRCFVFNQYRYIGLYMKCRPKTSNESRTHAIESLNDVPTNGPPADVGPLRVLQVFTRSAHRSSERTSLLA